MAGPLCKASLQADSFGWLWAGIGPMGTCVAEGASQAVRGQNTGVDSMGEDAI